jgi:SAM-dependent MidA family methyltransferase
LSALAQTGQTPDHYYILELSAELQHRQKQKIIQHIPHLQDRVVWLTRLPENFQGVIIANEVLDAMPVARFCYQDNQFWEYVVAHTNGALIEEKRLANENATLAEQLSALELTFSNNYQSEINLYLPSWLASLSKSMTCGSVLLIDYGFPRHAYYHPDRSMGTLMCHSQHKAHMDPYYLPGLQDITAHVDFTAISESAAAAGFSLAGYTTQANFLLDCGLMHLAEKKISSVRDNWVTSQAIKKLVYPSEMGELFKVIALTKNLSAPLPGFGLKNRKISTR